jgi:hypothetical protein
MPKASPDVQALFDRHHADYEQGKAALNELDEKRGALMRSLTRLEGALTALQQLGARPGGETASAVVPDAPDEPEAEDETVDLTPTPDRSLSLAEQLGVAPVHTELEEHPAKPENIPTPIPPPMPDPEPPPAAAAEA